MKNPYTQKQRAMVIQDEKSHPLNSGWLIRLFASDIPMPLDLLTCQVDAICFNRSGKVHKTHIREEINVTLHHSTTDAKLQMNNLMK